MEALELLEAAPAPRGAVHLQFLALDMLRPVAGLQRTRRAAKSIRAEGTTLAGRLYALRLQLQLTALSPDRSELDTLIAEARTLAARACAPTLAWTADWAVAVARAAADESEEAVAQASVAAHALEQHGEPYTATRLLADLLPLLDSDLRARIAADIAGRLERMGAHASALDAART